MKKNLFACMDEYTVLYTVGIYYNHVFREYPDGRITRANQQEIELALAMFSR